ncbi:hypothetical protein ABE10_03145 [Bacillus toyonensis]|nr:hypothetical protein [Bacillus toyonensis]
MARRLSIRPRRSALVHPGDQHLAVDDQDARRDRDRDERSQEAEQRPARESRDHDDGARDRDSAIHHSWRDQIGLHLHVDEVVDSGDDGGRRIGESAESGDETDQHDDRRAGQGPHERDEREEERDDGQHDGEGRTDDGEEDRAEDPVDHAHRDLSHDVVADRSGDLLGEVDEPRSLGGRDELVDGAFERGDRRGEVDREDEDDEGAEEAPHDRRADSHHAFRDRAPVLPEPLLGVADDLVEERRLQAGEDGEDPVLDVADVGALQERGDLAHELADLVDENRQHDQDDSGEDREDADDRGEHGGPAGEPVSGEEGDDRVQAQAHEQRRADIEKDRRQRLHAVDED